MSAGIGVDIVEISRMAQVLKKTPSFSSRVFTDEEQSYCNASSRPAAHYACRFAAREAVLKALGTGFSQGIGRKDVSVSKDAQGRPFVCLSGRAAEIARERHVLEVALSLSFSGDLAIANALAITEDARPRPKASKDAKRDRMARSFREARIVLDELEAEQDRGLLALQQGSSSEDESESKALTKPSDDAVQGSSPEEGRA